MNFYQKLFWAFAGLIFSISASAQNYQAINGSNYGGSLQVTNNPASILNLPFKWDVTPVAFQYKNNTNVFTLYSGSLFSVAKGVDSVLLVKGESKKYFAANFNVQLLNTRIRINRKTAVAFGITLRDYAYANTSKLNFDTILFTTVPDFASHNYNNVPLKIKGSNLFWGEIFGSVARNLIHSDFAVLNVGATIRIGRGFQGSYGNINNINFSAQQDNSGNYNAYLNSGYAEVGNSSTLDIFNNPDFSSSDFKKVLKESRLSMAMDLGVEYIIPATIESDKTNMFSYDYKFGLSLMDIGFVKFAYLPSASFIANVSSAGISAKTLDSKFRYINDYTEIADSVATLTSQFERLQGKMKMMTPTRLVLNVDKYLAYGAYINGELTLPLSQLIKTNGAVARENNLLAITPRYESQYFSCYLPITLNWNMKTMVGLAFRAGPLLLGFHNVANIFGKNKLQNGGAYIALTFRPGQKATDKHKTQWYDANNDPNPDERKCKSAEYQQQFKRDLKSTGK